MNLRVFNTTYRELRGKKHHIFIGISVGVKPMSHDMALSYLEWAEQHSTGVVQILIADEITHFNYLVFSHSTKPGALSRAIRDGDRYQAFFEKILAEFYVAKRNRYSNNKMERHSIFLFSNAFKKSRGRICNEF